MKYFFFLFSLLCFFVSCSLPKTDRALSFNYKNLSPDMLNGTIWVGPLTLYPYNSSDRFMAVRYENGRVGLGRGQTKDQAIKTVKDLVLYTDFLTSGSTVNITNFFDSKFGRVNAEVIYLSNNRAQLIMFRSTTPGSSRIFETDNAVRVY